MNSFLDVTTRGREWASVLTSVADFDEALRAYAPDALNHPKCHKKHWLVSELTIFGAARNQRSQLNADQLKGLLNVVNHPQLIGFLTERMNQLQQFYGMEVRTQTTDQLVHTTLGALNAVLAAHHFSRWNAESKDPLADDAVLAVAECLRHYHAAWDLQSPRIKVLPGHAAGSIHPDRVTAFLNAFARQLPTDLIDAWTESNWLLLRRLLSYLIGDKDTAVQGDLNRIQMLLACSDGYGGNLGRTASVDVAAHLEGFASAYLDPVALGVTVLDSQMLDSLRIAARIAQPLLQKAIPGRESGHQELALRIGPNPGAAEFLVLEGASAGGIVTLAACATAEGHRLNRDITASFTVGVDEDALRRSPNTPLSIEDIRFGTVSSGSIEAKLTSPDFQRAGLKTVFLHHTQTSGAEGQAAKWPDWAPRVEQSASLQIRPVEEGMTLAQLIHDMTGDERIEAIIRKHAHRARADWSSMLAGTSPEDHKLETHVEPRLSVELRPEEIRARREAIQKQASKDVDSLQLEQLQFETLPAGLDLFRQRYIDKEWNWILITERAGGGKTVLSWQLRDTLSDGDRPYFVVRYENTWPTDLRKSLEKEIKKDCPREITPQEAVDWLIENKRIVVIFDALDQVSLETAELLTRLCSDPDDPAINSQSIRVIVTSRPEAVNRWPEGFDKRFWRHFHLEEFDEQQRKAYVDKFAAYRDRKVSGEGAHILGLWEQVTAKQTDTDVISLPNNLREIRLMIEEHRDEGTPIRAFQTAGDLRWEMAFRNLSRDPFKGKWKRRDAGLVTELIRAAACLAFELLRQTGTYIAHGETIASIKQSAQQRFGGGRWEEYDALLRDSLTSGAAVLRRNNREELSFPSQKTMEFFAGLYLARYADETAIQELQPLVGHSQWNEAWTFTIEMLLTTNAEGDSLHKADAMQRSLSALFAAPADVPRPTQLMFRAWQIMERVKFPRRQVVLESYRQQFLDILSGNAAIPPMKLSEGAEVPTRLNRAQRAAEVITERDLWEHVRAGRTGTFSFRDLRPDYVEQLAPLLGKQNAAEVTDADIGEWFRRKGDELPPDLRPAHSAYSLCSNATSKSPCAKPSVDKDCLTFLMGAIPRDTSADDNEKYDKSREETWWIEQEIKAFQMATCCVTRAQYRLFDPHREQSDSESKNKLSPDDDCPITHVDWWDAFCFGLWLGEEYQLPTEKQWEGAAWSGIDRKKHREAIVSVFPYHSGFTSSNFNFNGIFPFNMQLESDCPGRTLPVRWDDQRRRSPLSEPQPERLPSAYKANGFGLWHVNGNVWEWCESGWEGTLKEVIEGGDKDMAGEDVNLRARRVIRGGSWIDDAKHIRTSNRGWYDAGLRYNGLGFRLSRTRSN